MANGPSLPVLRDLARSVESLNTATGADSDMLRHVVDGEAQYPQLAEKILTEPTGLGFGQPAALDALSRLGENVEGALGHVADGQKARAEELEQINKKEIEEKEGDPKKGGGGGGTGGDDEKKPKDNGDKPADEDKDKDKKDPKKTEEDKKEIPEEDPPGSDPKKEDGAGADTGTTPPATPPPQEPTEPSRPPPAGSGTTGDGTVPPEPKKPEKPKQAKQPEKKEKKKKRGSVEVVGKRTRRCFKFRIGNGTNKPVSDLHFDGKGMSMTSSSVGSNTGVKGWTPYNVPGGDGFWFGADKGTKPLPPNKGLGPFEFCTESSPKGFDIWFSHPDGSRTRLDPNNIRTRRGRARQRNGKTLLPPDTTETVYDIEITADGGGSELTVEASGGRLKPGTAADSKTTSGGVRNNNRRLLDINTVPMSREFGKGEKVRATVTSSSSNLKFKVKPE